MRPPDSQLGWSFMTRWVATRPLTRHRSRFSSQGTHDGHLGVWWVYSPHRVAHHEGRTRRVRVQRLANVVNHLEPVVNLPETEAGAAQDFQWQAHPPCPIVT